MVISPNIVTRNGICLKIPYGNIFYLVQDDYIYIHSCTWIAPVNGKRTSVPWAKVPSLQVLPMSRCSGPHGGVETPQGRDIFRLVISHILDLQPFYNHMTGMMMSNWYFREGVEATNQVVTETCPELLLKTWGELGCDPSKIFEDSQHC